jgi:hypothetical protein
MWRVLAAAFLLCLSGMARAEPPAPQQASELARRFVSIGGAEALFIEGAVRGFEATLQRLNVNLTEAQRQRLRPTLVATFDDPARIYVDEMAGFFTRTAASADLEAAVSYYESEPGQHYAAAVVDLVMAISLFSVSGGRTELPSVPEGDGFDPAVFAASQRLAEAFRNRLSEVEAERLAVAGIDPTDFTDWMARYVANRLTLSDIEAAVAWAESPESRRLEGPSAERSAAEELATLRAIRAIDGSAIQRELEIIRRENPA